MYKLDKPYTEQEKTNFIFRYNQNCFREGFNCRIEETETSLYALEDNEIIVDGQVIVNPNYEQEQLIKQKQEQIEEIKEELNELDLKSIRSIRANETDRISQYEQEAQTLRDELNELISEIKELEE